jgi:DNA mismatch repair ATPase MutS
MTHIVLLIQLSSSSKSREWADFTTIQDCCEYICKLYEKHLKKKHPNKAQITYDITDVYAFIDNVSRDELEIQSHVSSSQKSLFRCAT